MADDLFASEYVLLPLYRVDESGHSGPLGVRQRVAAWRATLRVPQAVAGGHTLLASGQSSGRLASTSVQVKPALILVPSSGRAGSLAYLIGVGFGGTETLAGLWYPGWKVLNTGTTTALGSVVMTFTVPLSATGSYAVVGYGLSSKQVTVAGFSLTAAVQVQLQTGLARRAAATQAVPRVDLRRRVARRTGGRPQRSG